MDPNNNKNNDSANNSINNSTNNINFYNNNNKLNKSNNNKQIKSSEGYHDKFINEYKVQPCKLINCVRDRDCFFYHKKDEIRRAPFNNENKLLYSHNICPNIGNCNDGNCGFSHNELEVMYHPYVFKTKMCHNFTASRSCKKSWCSYAHLESEKRVIEKNKSKKFNFAAFNNNNNRNNNNNNNDSFKSFNLNQSPTTSSSSSSSSPTSSVNSQILSFNNNNNGGNNVYYNDHYSSFEVNSSLKNKLVGKIKVKKSNPFNSIFIISDPSNSNSISNGQLHISGYYNRNRSFHNDIVVIEILSNNNDNNSIVPSQEELLFEKIFKDTIKPATTQNNITHQQQQQQIESIKSNSNNNNNLIECKVVSIIKSQHQEIYCCKFLKKKDQFLLFEPVNCKLACIMVPMDQQQHSLSNNNELYEIKIDQPWSKNTLFPIGIILNHFSTENEFKKSIETLKIENGYSNSALFPSLTNNNVGGLSINLIESLNAICLENNNQSNNNNNNENYEDLTNLFSFSIQLDQENCDNEISNTFSFSKNEKTGEIRVYVHFVDCTNLIKVGSKLDRVASSIGLKINFNNIDRVNMIDQEFILENLSLLPGGSKRKCFTIEWSYTANKSVSTRVYKSIVKSSYHLTSIQEVLNVLNNKDGNNNGLIMEESVFKQLKLNLQILKSDVLCKNSIYTMNNSKPIFQYSSASGGNIGTMKPIGIETENLELINILNSIDEIKMLANYVTTYTLVDSKISGLIYKVSNSNIESSLFQEQNLFNLVPLIENNCKEQSLILNFILNQIQKLESYSSNPNQFHKFPFYGEFLNPLSNYTALYNQRILNIKFNNTGNGGSGNNSNVLGLNVSDNLIETVISNCNLKFEKSKKVLKKFTKLSFKSTLESKPSIVLSVLVVGITSKHIQVWCKEYCKLFTIDIPNLNDGELLINLNDSEFIYNQDHSIQTKLLEPIKIQISKQPIQHVGNGSMLFQLSFLNSIQSSPSYNCNHNHNQDIFLKQPIQDLKTGNLPNKFDSFNQYIDFQISLIDLNSIYKSIPNAKPNNNSDGSSIYFSNVSISFSKKKKKYLGTIEIPLSKLPLGFNKFAKGDFICCNFPGNDRNQPFGIHSIISKVDYAIKTPNTITIKFQVKIDKIPQRFPFFIEIIFRDPFNRDLLIGAQLFSEINHSTKQPSPVQSLISTGTIDSNVAFSSSSSFYQSPKDCFLNSSQEMALQSSLNNSITIIEGESGCGKTLLSFLICKFAISDLKLTDKVLISGPNDESLDASCKSFLDFNCNFKMVRFNSITRQVFSVESSSPSSIISTIVNSIENSTTSASALLNGANIIFCTTIGSINPIIRDLNIKWVIIDNSHQEIEQKSLCAISYQTERLILLGDAISDISVGPISVKSKKFRNLMKIPLSKRLSSFIKPITLSTRYAPIIFNSLLSMDKINFQEIQNYNNFYNQKAYYSFFNLESIENINYDIGNLNKQLDEKEMIQKFTNHQQVEFVIKLVEYLTVKQKVDPSEIVIVSPFESQRKLIKKSIIEASIFGPNVSFNVLSIEKSQYYHFNYVIYSLVRTEGNASKSYWIESDQRTIKKMALVPKKGLFFIGSSNYFQKRERWNHLINHTRKLDSFVNVPLFGSFSFFINEMKTHNAIFLKLQN